MGDEKWILYNHIERKKSLGKQNKPPTTTSKAGLHPKVMLCLWWDWKGVLYYELLPENQMIDSSKYCSQSDQLKVALSGNHPLVNRKCIIFNQDNAKTTCVFDDQAKTVRAWVCAGLCVSVGISLVTALFQQ